MRKSLDRFLELRSEKAPVATELPPRQDPSAGVFLDRVGLQVQERGNVRDREHVLARDAHVRTGLDGAACFLTLRDDLGTASPGLGWQQKNTVA
jgi:hypothetical protein